MDREKPSPHVCAETRRRTPQRAAIRAVFAEVNHPLTAAEILKMARRRVRSLNAATVYRNLNRLVEEGWLCCVVVPRVGTHFERAGKPHHHHFHCHSCDRVLELDGCGVRAQRMAPEGFTVESHELFLSGVCDRCNGRRA